MIGLGRSDPNSEIERAENREWRRCKGQTLTLQGRAIIALSGQVASGKTTLANALKQGLAAHVISTGELLRERAGSDERRALQELGEELDRQEGGSWVARPVLEAHNRRKDVLIVDSARTHAQLAAMRKAARLIHVHLTAPEAVLDQRYRERRVRNSDSELASRADLRRSRTEADIDDLAGHADVVLDTHEVTVAETCHRVIALVESVRSTQEDIA